MYGRFSSDTRDENEKDNIYLNLHFQAKDPQSNEKVVLSYTSAKTRPVIDKANDYYLAIVSFDLPLLNLPITICPIMPNQSDSPNKTPLTIGIRKGVTQHYRHVMFEPQLYNYRAPTQDAPQQIITPYHYIYDYNWMLKLINNQLKEVLSIDFFPEPPYPYFVYDEVTQLISVILPSSFTVVDENGNLAYNTPRICINGPMLQYLNNFPWYEDTTGGGVQFYLDPIKGNLRDIHAYGLNNTTPTNPPAFYKITQTASMIQYWSPVRKIIFKTDILPVSQEFVQVPGNSCPTTSIITDFTPKITLSSDSRSVVFYSPNPQYRLVDLLNSSPIYTISIQVEWQDNYGNIEPVLMPAYTSAAVKIGFFRKSLYKN